MTQPPTFSAATHPLRGMHLVEASAGTGKTFNITTLVVRLVIEANLTIDQILVVSFAKASTADLRSRVRGRIVEAIDAFEAGQSPDAVLDSLARSAVPVVGLERLRAALRDFDRAAIYTIHSFCQRALVEFAFESGEPFSVEFVEGADELYLEQCQDHWARTAYTADPAWLEGVADVISSPKSLLDIARYASERPDLQVLPDTSTVPTQAQLATLRARFEACAALWRAGGSTILADLDYGNGRLKADYQAPKIEGPLASLGSLLSGQTPKGPRVPAKSGMFTLAALLANVKGKGPVNFHGFFAAWQAYLDLAVPLLNGEKIALQADLRRTARKGLDAHKNQANIRAYSDLLVRLADAMRGANGRVLADALFRRYPAALIDEFQDTDPVQFSVFEAMYQGGRGALFLIGDPKQAIYAFRGGDIYAYLRAAGRSPPSTLDVNFRSDRALVEALGLLYPRTPLPFVDARIPFHPVTAAKGVRLRGPSGEPAPLQLRMLRKAGKGQKAITSGWADDNLADLVAVDIVRFLRSDALFLRGTRTDGSADWTTPRASDCAVLVRKNLDAERVHRALRALGVPSVVTSDTSVFQSAAAGELHALLDAIVHASSDRRIRAAVVSPLVGLSANQLAEAVVDDARWAEWAITFRELHERWADHGFAAVFRRLMGEPLSELHGAAEPRLLSEPGGERRVTNLLHLGELLQRREQSHTLTPAALLAWFGLRIANAGDASDDEEMRLESDADAATIMTVYKAKGLQFPVVWVPYGHVNFGASDTRPMYHGDPPEEDATVSFDPGEWGANAVRAGVEAQAQERRILYVSLTRAAHRLTVFSGEWHKGGKSALDALLHPTVTLDEDARMSELDALAGASGGRIGASWFDETKEARIRLAAADATGLMLGKFSGRIRTSWRRSSYTGLTGTKGIAPEAPEDHDEAVDDEAAEATLGARPPGVSGAASAGFALPMDSLPCGFADFPRGKRPGITLHALYEHADFLDLGAALDAMVAERLAAERVDAKHVGPAAAGVRASLNTDLGGSLAGFTLGQLPRERRLDELAFTFPVSSRGPGAPNLRQRDLVNFFVTHGEIELAERVAALTFGRLRGHLHGKIDLVFEHSGRFYVVDYKSNHLGPTLGDYASTQMSRAMAEHSYDLQYLVYSVAVHRFLTLRLPGYQFATHFGGVRYLFIRGMTSATGAARGVFAATPAESLVVGLSELLRSPPGGAS